jgi:hypothetical protein
MKDRRIRREKADIEVIKGRENEKCERRRGNK